MRHLTAGPRALEAMARLLGLEGGEEGWRLEGFCAQDRDCLRVSLRRGEHRLAFAVLPPGAPEGRRRAGGLSLALEGAGGAAAERFLAAAAARLATESLESLFGLLEADPLSFAQTMVPGQDGDRVKVPCVGQPVDLLEDGWRNFYADQDFEILLGVPECVPEGAVNIQYADLECYYARPKRSFRKWSFLDWPEAGISETAIPSGSIAELEERDMILGTGERADALVDEARARAKDGKHLVITHLCTPIVMGEDFQGLARRCEAACGATAVRWSQKDRDENDNFGEHFRALLARPGFFDAAANERAVNLFHFPGRVRREEVSPFLERLGLRTNLCVFPEVDFPSLASLPAARWQVFCERSSYPTKLKELLERSPRPVIVAPAPYGVERTRRCLETIAAAAGKAGEFEAAWRQLWAGRQAAWEALKTEASGCRLAFVASEATLPRLCRLRYGCGAPLAVMAAELGFGVDLLYYDLHGEAPALPAELAGFSVELETFRSPWELERALARSRAQAVYSDIVFDRRISRAGKARFSSRDFEMGLDGARRTLERLLDLCRLPFYRSYARQLARQTGRDDGDR